MSLSKIVETLSSNVRLGSRKLRGCSLDQRNAALVKMAALLRSETSQILRANAKDTEAAKDNGLSMAMIDRLTLTAERIEAMAEATEQIAAFPDPLGGIIREHTTDAGLKISQVRVPIGAILFIYESRPNVTIDGAALCLKSGNAVILRGGRESMHSSKVLADLVRQGLEAENLPVEAVQLVENPDREIVSRLLQRTDALDLVIPRGGEGLIKAVVEQSKIPVIKHYKGVCHVYVDGAANMEKAVKIVQNAKIQRPGVCNAMETLLLDEALGQDKATTILQNLLEKGVSLFGCEKTHSWFPAADLVEPDQYYTEYLDLKCSVRVVQGVQGAMDHIEEFGSGHTEAVVSEDAEVLHTFLQGVDSSSVMANASTRFADGGEYGLGAEVGISTDKLHARGPMGVDSLTTYKWVVHGDGHIRG